MHEWDARRADGARLRRCARRRHPRVRPPPCVCGVVREDVTPISPTTPRLRRCARRRHPDDPHHLASAALCAKTSPRRPPPPRVCGVVRRDVTPPVPPARTRPDLPSVPTLHTLYPHLTPSAAGAKSGYGVRSGVPGVKGAQAGPSAVPPANGGRRSSGPQGSSTGERRQDLHRHRIGPLPGEF